MSRFTAAGDDAAFQAVETILLEGDDQSKLGGVVPAGHQGGAIHFGKDGKLYVALGEQTAGAPAQAMDSLFGKLLRINSDGSIPEDNPFFRTARGRALAPIWALGLRNPFTFAVQPETGRIFLNDVGRRPPGKRSTRARPAEILVGPRRKDQPPTYGSVVRFTTILSPRSPAVPSARPGVGPAFRLAIAASTSSPIS